MKERFGRSVWVFIVYDLAKKESLDYALALILEARREEDERKGGGRKLLGTSASLLVTGALLVVTRSY